ncbi:MAG: 50S ribosomal protein L15 [bacterium]|nr:50S ribosomal protein L15 [bacterium]
MALTQHTLKPAKGAKHRRKRVGRGNASGHGTYSTRGQKGQRARSGGRKGLKRMGMRRLLMSIPKVRGFKSLESRPTGINVGDLNSVVKPGEKITRQRLVALGLVDPTEKKIKILGDGNITKAITLEGIPSSATAREKIIAAGGSIE